MTIDIIFKSGAKFGIECEYFNLVKNGFGAPTSCEIKGVTQNKPLYISFDDIAAIVRRREDS